MFIETYFLSCRCALIVPMRLPSSASSGNCCRRTCKSMLVRSLLMSGFWDDRAKARHWNRLPSLQYSSFARAVLPTPPGPTMDITLNCCSPSPVNQSPSFSMELSIPTRSIAFNPYSGGIGNSSESILVARLWCMSRLYLLCR